MIAAVRVGTSEEEFKQSVVDEVCSEQCDVAKDELEGRFHVVACIQRNGDMAGMRDVLKLRGITSLGHCISCFGGVFPKGPLSSLSEEDLHQCVERSMPHIRLLKEVWPMIEDASQSSYLIIDGMLGERSSMPDVAGLSIANGFLYGCIIAFQAERSSSQVRINEMRIGAMLRKRNSTSHPFMKSSSSAFPSDLIGQKVLDVLSGDVDRKIIRVTSDDLVTMKKQHDNVE